jgi:serine protease AprX
VNLRRLLCIGAALLAMVSAAPSFAQLLLLGPSLSSLTLSPASLTGGSPSTGRVTLDGPAPLLGARVTLSSNNPAVAVPASVVISFGGTSATFSVTTSAVAVATVVMISASYGGETRAAPLTVLPIAEVLPSVSSLTVSPASVTGGTPAAGTVTLNGPAPASGAQVTLISNDPAATVPASVTVSPGATNASFSLTTSAVAASTLVTISASYGGATQTASLTVLPIVEVPPIVSSLTVSPASVTGGTPATGTVTLNKPAPADGAQVTLSSNDPAAAVPASVTVSPGATSTGFSVTTSMVASSTLVTLSASHGGATQTASLTVRPIEADKIDPDLLALMQKFPSGVFPVIVEMQPLPPSGGGAVNVILADNAFGLLPILQQLGHYVPLVKLPLINAAAGMANIVGIGALSGEQTVAFIHHDRNVGPRQSAAEPPPTPAEQVSDDYPQVVRAHKAWEDGIRGSGITVAVLDSGVEADPDLTSPSNRLLASVNFAGPATTSDPGGHGTHIAGIIAGNGSRSGGQIKGIAPRANIVDVRVLSKEGRGRVSSVIRGIEWTLAHRAMYNIRVINLSFGARNTLSHRADPLSTAVEIAWRRGLVVVAAAGNTGPERDTVVSPGINPYVITVGATDDRGTRGRGDDLFAWFSAWGSADSHPKPDLVAPGRRLASIHVPGSKLHELFPERVVSAANGSTYFRLTGTSMATGVVSGAAALVLQRRPDLTPDEVKGVLVDNTQGYGAESGQVLPDPIADGRGLLDAQDATDAAGRWWTRPRAANQGLRPSDGFARALYPVLYGTSLLGMWKDPTLGGILWNLLTWDTLVWDSIAWDNFNWDSIAWDSIAWDSVAWDSIAWDSVAWDSIAWDSIAWDSVAWDTYTLD